MVKKNKNKFPFLEDGREKWGLWGSFVAILLSVFIAQFILQLFQNNLNSRLVVNFIFAWHTEKFLISMGVLLIGALWLWAVTDNAKVVNRIVILASLLLGYITYEKMLKRGEPLYPSDFKMVSELGFIMRMLSPLALIILIVVTVLAIIWLVFSIRQPHLKLGKKRRILLFVMTSLGLFYISQFQVEGNLVKRLYDRTANWIPYSQKMNYYNTGFVAGFLYNLPSAPMDQPDKVTDADLDALVTKYQERADEINKSRSNGHLETNIVYIMNESFSDPLTLGRASAGFDPIPFTRELATQYRSGKMLSQGYGGGTANIEFEALTGFSMEPLNSNISTPYTQFLPKMKTFPSLVTRLKAQGHHTLAIHPFDTSMYKRRDNYDVLGFDAFYYEDTMTYTQRKENSPYISDQSAYQEVMMRMQESSELDFVHLVTMQNHSPYTNLYKNPPTESQTGFSKDEINQYHQDLQYSDQALETLFQEIQEWDEPTVVVLWGDHWPSVFGENVEKTHGKTLYQTPVVFFGNQKMSSRDLQVTSPIYFQIELFDILDSPVSPFDAFLMALQEEVPAFEKGVYYLPNQTEPLESRQALSKKANQLLADYDRIMYDVTTGKNKLEKNGFFEAP